MKIGKTAAKIFLLYTGLTIAYTSSVLGQSIDDISNFLFNNTTLKESVAVSDKSSNMTKKLNETLNKTLSRKHNLKLRTKVQDLDEIINGVEEINLLYVEKQKNKKFKYVIGNEEVEKHETVQNIDIPTNIRIDSLTIKDLNEYIQK